MSALDTLITNLQTIYNEVTTKVIPTNIKSGVTVFGTTGTVVELEGETTTITPTDIQQVITPSTGNGFTEVTVNTDVNLTPENIKAGVTIFGVTGTYTGEDASL